jgi:hypothetical protein
MQRLIDHAVRPGGSPRGRFALLALAAALLALALPTLASAATQTLTVEKAGSGTGTVTSSPPGFIECGSTCSAPIPEGTTIVLSGSPGLNSAAVVWTGCAHVDLENECSVTMSAAKTVTATFNLIERPLTVSKKGTATGTVTSSPAGIECGGKCSASFVKGTVVTLSATPGPGSEPVLWGGCESVVEGKCAVTMSTAKSVTATFDLPAFQLTVKKEGSGTGTVTSFPAGIECGGVCSAPFAEKSTVTLTGSPGANSAAVLWTGCASINGENKCLVTMGAAKEVTATFKLLSRQLTVKKAGPGTVTSSPAGINCGLKCAAGFEHGTLVTLTGAPEGNAEAVEWAGCGSVDAEGRCLVTMSAAREVTATFPIGLTISKVGTGTGTVTSAPAGIACGATCSARFANGVTVTLEGKSDLHSRPVKWSGCAKVLKDGKCQIVMSASTNVIANFELESQYLEHTVTVQLGGTGKGSVASQPGGIECGGDCTEKFLHKTSLTLTPSPAPGSVFDHWVGGGCAAFTGPCQTIVNSSSLVRAYFVAVGPRTLTLAKAGSGSGTVASKPVGIECGSTCSAQFEAPTKVVLKSVAAKGSLFKGWSGEGCSGTAACRVTMTEARNVTATFEKTAAPPPSPSEVFVSSSARVKGGRALLRVACNGPSPCQGTLKLLLKIRNAEGQTKGLVVGSAPFSLAAGTVQTLPVKLSQRAMRMLASTGRLKLRIVGASESHVLRLGQRPS